MNPKDEQSAGRQAEGLGADAVSEARVTLSVHVQLRTSEKLFCRCPVGAYRDDYDAEILRHMRPTHSESGAFDASAVQATAQTNIYYRIHHTSVCTYEFDDNPPFPINQDAFTAAVEIAQACGSVEVDELHVVRAERLDGSFPGGFQRGAVVGVGGSLSLGNQHFALRHVALLEDSCRRCETSGQDRVYFTDRLGVPLVSFLLEPLPPDAAKHSASMAVAAIQRLARDQVRTGTDALRCDLSVEANERGLVRRDLTDPSDLARSVEESVAALRDRTGHLPGEWLVYSAPRIYAETDLPPIPGLAAAKASSVRAQR